MTPLIAAGLVFGGAGLVMLIAAQYLGHRAVTERDPEAVRAEVHATLHRDGWTASVRIYRERTGAGLLEAHDAVRRIARENR
ncbi:hypothetical protein Ait01nite_084510 [Actinoplanes italicus]|uniref:Uncharacterized protein n=1 Tax=Actinoplanes italicus TaxID=113567 RepID=A0A2T0JXA9_9ACTN|nr:hypothetical protein [Actinoplanes italicus]PRX12638.1 hypothetical protein CLV67_12761 [Actinoplanes italicus]GIE35406.1 hypothetical protein Ait01nite_084510 [Actinoplanes italicus]